MSNDLCINKWSVSNSREPVVLPDADGIEDCRNMVGCGYITCAVRGCEAAIATRQLRLEPDITLVEKRNSSACPYRVEAEHVEEALTDIVETDYRTVSV